MAKLIDRMTLQSYVGIPDQFRDPELRAATFRLTGTRLTMWSGGRAVVFQAQMADGAKLAVRIAITTDGDHLRVPYLALADWMKVNPLPYLARTEWIDGGLALEDAEVSLLKMEWIDGSSLDDHIDDCIARNQPAELLHLAEEWRKATAAMATARFAHGDLHAQNVLVSHSDSPARFRFVDYDSVWLPGLTNPPAEVGHQAFQHPRREWGEHMDAFGATVIYLSLRASAAQPKLWTEFHRGDMTLLIEETDLRGNDERGVWSKIAQNDDEVVRSLATELRSWSEAPADKHLSLESVLRAAGPGIVQTWPPSKKVPSQPVHQSWPSPQPSAPPSVGKPPKAQQTWPGGSPATPPAPPAFPPPGTPSATSATGQTGAPKPKERRPTTTEWFIIGGILLLILIAILNS
jgi:eukaryotic-like serine/threonine-protein kinase